MDARYLRTFSGNVPSNGVSNKPEIKREKIIKKKNRDKFLHGKTLSILYHRGFINMQLHIDRVNLSEFVNPKHKFLSMQWTNSPTKMH